MNKQLEKDLKILARATNSFAKKHPDVYVVTTHCAKNNSTTDLTWVTYRCATDEKIMALNSWLSDGKYQLGEIE